MGKYSEILTFAVEAAKRAGDYVRDARADGLKIDAKSAIDFVSDKDRESEDIIRSAVKDRYPEHLFFAEESVYGESLEQERKDLLSFRDEDYVWVIDPIDGTVNYIHDIPMYAISIAVLHHRRIVAGVIYDPVRRETYYAEEGCGAWLNETPIHVTDAPAMDQMIISTSAPTSSMEQRRKMMKIIPAVSERFQGYRIWNCASMSLASVAAGRTDANYEAGIHLWDMAAGIILVREAGGTATMIDGSPLELTATEVLVSNGQAHQAIAELLSSEIG